MRPELLLALLLGCGASGGSTTEGSSTGDASVTGDAPSTGAAPTSGEAPTSGTTGAEPLPGACDAPIAPVPRTSARLQVDATGTLRDEHGRDVQLRGVNAGGRSKWSPFVPFPIADDATPAQVQEAAAPFFARLRAWGLDTVRLPFSWEGVEPEQGEYDQRYLDRYAAMIDAAWALQIRVIVDFHQDVYASPFCGDGFPLWTIAGEHGPPRRDCPNWGLAYIYDDAVRGAFDRFWANEDDLQGAFKKMWEVMGGRVADHPGVVGLEIVNEPGWGSAPSIDTWKQEVLTPFHSDMIAHLRAKFGDELLLFYDATGIEAVGLVPALHLRPEGEGLVYAPHVYDAGLIAGNPYTGSGPPARAGPTGGRTRAPSAGTRWACVWCPASPPLGEAPCATCCWTSGPFSGCATRAMCGAFWRCAWAPCCSCASATSNPPSVPCCCPTRLVWACLQPSAWTWPWPWACRRS